jgi:hypothetical protein
MRLDSFYVRVVVLGCGADTRLYAGEGGRRDGELGRRVVGVIGRLERTQCICKLRESL